MEILIWIKLLNMTLYELTEAPQATEWVFEIPQLLMRSNVHSETNTLALRMFRYHAAQVDKIDLMCMQS